MSDITEGVRTLIYNLSNNFQSLAQLARVCDLLREGLVN